HACLHAPRTVPEHSQFTVVPAATVTLTRTATGVALTPAASFVVSGIQQDFRGANNYRPNITCDPASASPTITAYFNASCVVIPTGPSKPCGNAPRNSVRGPSFWQVDLALSK